MVRKSSLRSVAAASLVFGLACCLFASCAKEERSDEPSGDTRDLLEKFRSVPYTNVMEEKTDGEPSGVTIHVPGKAWPGYNLHCLRTESAAALLDMDGKEVHRWSVDEGFKRGWPYGVVLANGDLITFREDREILRLDWDSNLIWRVNVGAHHEIWPLPDGSFYALLRRTRRHRGVPIRISDITRFSGDGEIVDRWSSYEHLDHIKQNLDTRSFFDTFLDSLEAIGIDIAEMDTLPDALHRTRAAGQRVYVYFHMNTISVLPDTPTGQKDRRFRAGNILTCFRNVNQVAVLDKDTKEILWAWGEGELEWPHHPTMLDNGNILIFDNGVVRESSRVIELNPVTETVEWQYSGDTPGEFYTRTRGSAQRLPNGNTLICEGNRGRCFEVTREGEIVWQWINPMEKDGHRVQVYRMMRYAPGFIEPLLEAGR